MAQNITLLGASYSAVPAVTLPKTGGGTASFTDVSDTTATAADVASGTYFYTAAGERTEGTASGGGGGGTTSVTVNGWASVALLYYVDGTMTVQNTTSNPSPITCMSKSIFVLLRGLPEPGTDAPTYSNATLITSISLGSRATYRYADIVQVD